MNAVPPILPQRAASDRCDFYVTGGTLRPDAPSYVERQADRDLCQGLLNGEFCYVLTSRQMGKSSLMVRTVKRLRQEGVSVAVLDLTAIGQNLSIEQWYDGLVSRLGQQLNLEDELLDFWQEHPEWGPLQRWLTAIEAVVLKRIPGKVVIFVDEIDIVRSLPFSTDEFFAAIREAYNRRSREPAFERLAFGLLGVASPTDLIRDTRMTPFNIGRRVELNDFTDDEAAPLAQGLASDPDSAKALLQRVLYWTGGHPYLTQRLCRAVADSVYCPPENDGNNGPLLPPVIPSRDTIDEFAEKLFLSRQARDRDDNLIFVRERVLRSELDVPGLLYLYRKILNGARVADDDTNPLVSILRLSGIVRGFNGYLHVRNRIYSRVFDAAWIQTNMPEAETRRQRTARRRGMVYGLTIAVVLLLVYLLVWPAIVRIREERRTVRTVQQLQSSYRGLASYRDKFESTLEVAVGDVTVPVVASGSLIFERPNRLNLVFNSQYTDADFQIRIVSDGRARLVQAPSLREFQMQMASEDPLEFPAPLAAMAGPSRLLPVYRLFLNPRELDRFTMDAKIVDHAANGELDGRRVQTLRWNHRAAPILAALGLPGKEAETAPVPITAWLDGDHRIIQIQANLSNWASQLIGTPGLQVTSLILTEKHISVEADYAPPTKPPFRLAPVPGSHPVAEFKTPAVDITAVTKLKRQFATLIPARIPLTPPNLIDLTDYYNAPLVQAWHPGLPGNNLDALPKGLLQFDHELFDVRGIVQLSGKQLYQSGARYPERISGIPIDQKCRELHFLQACAWMTKDGTRIGEYIVHFEDGTEATIPLVYGEDLRDWSADTDPAAGLKRARQVWSAMNNARVRVRLFKLSWVNPYPDTPITSIDFVSAMRDPAPFLIAMTAAE